MANSTFADLGKGNPRSAVESIVKQVIANSDGDFSKLRRINQLRIMAQLRNLAPENLAIMDDLTGYFTKERDFLYIMGERDGLEKGIEKGLKKGIEESKKEIVRNLLLNTDFTIAKIASLVNVSHFYVRKIKKTLK
jgi:predicted transposase YdaD